MITYTYKTPFLTGAHSPVQLLRTFTITKDTSATDVLSQADKLLSHTCTHVHPPTGMHARAHAGMHACAHIHTYTNTDTHIHTSIILGKGRL